MKIKLNPRKMYVFLQMLFLIPACAGFYTALVGYLLAALITLEPLYWRYIAIVLFVSFVIAGLYAARVYLKKTGRLYL